MGAMDTERQRANSALPRFMNAVTAMATSRERTVRGRLASVAADVLVFKEENLPEEVRERYQEFGRFFDGIKMPKGAKSHRIFPRATPAYYMSNPKAHRAAALLTSMLTSLVYASMRKDDAD